MLAKTHGQPASPTNLGKEIRVFSERIKGQLEQLKDISCDAKFGGATGNFNAHHIAYPEISWKAFGNHFLKKHLDWSEPSTLHKLRITTIMRPFLIQ